MNYFPRSLFGRNVALLLATVLVSQIVAVTSFVVFMQRPRIEEAAGFFANQIVIMERALGDVPEAQRKAYVDRLLGQSLPPTTAQAIDDINIPRPFANIELRTFLRALSKRLSGSTDLRWQAGEPAHLWVRFSIAGEHYWVPLPVARGDRYPGLWIAIAASLVLSSLVTFAAFAIHRRINLPLSQLVSAANVVGRGKWPEPVAEHGTMEILQLSRTFNAMTIRLAESEAARAAMLAGISHDIRTPLTKLRLAIALYSPSMREKPQQMLGVDHDERSMGALPASFPDPERYIDEIDAILQQFIDFARGTEGEPRSMGDVNSVIQQLAADFAGLGYHFDLHLSALPRIPFGQTSLLRLLMNLMENAVRYGQFGLAVSTESDASWVTITVVDRGPGVSKAFLPLMLQPFRRGENSTGKDGTGMGLAIARRIAVEHGGDLTVSLRQRGGMAFRVQLSVT